MSTDTKPPVYNPLEDGGTLEDSILEPWNAPRPIPKPENPSEEETEPQ